MERLYSEVTAIKESLQKDYVTLEKHEGTRATLADMFADVIKKMGPASSGSPDGGDAGLGASSMSSGQSGAKAKSLLLAKHRCQMC